MNRRTTIASMIAILVCVSLTACFSRTSPFAGTVVRSPLAIGNLELAGPVDGGRLLHYTIGSDEGNAGTIDYRGLDPEALSIVGAGVSTPDRKVRIFDDLIVTGRTHVSGTAATITAGTGAPTAREANGSLYLRTDGTNGQRLCVSAGSGMWHCVPGI